MACFSLPRKAVARRVLGLAAAAAATALAGCAYNSAPGGTNALVDGPRAFQDTTHGAEGDMTSP